MATQALLYVLETIFNLFALAALTRFYAQAFRAPFRNPVANFVVALTDFAVKPLRRVVPGAMGLDLASLIVAWLTQVLLLIAMYALVSTAILVSPGFWPGVALLALVKVVKLSIYLLMGVVFILAIMSWMNPYHPIRPFFEALARPFLKPFQRIIPLVGGVDLSPLALLLLLQVILMVPMVWLEGEAGRALSRMVGTG
ncbi:MAG: YggT family protein [Betaproteobacteria bacterium]|nr:YggT family protein [Betaproteobacteria bacterium]